MRYSTLAVIVALSIVGARSASAQSETLTVPTFGQVTLYIPSTTPSEVVLFISGDGGWNLGVVAMAERLRDLGALVVGIDIRSLLHSLEAAQGCAYPAGDLEELSRNIQLRQKLPAYKRPLLVGYSSGATLVYAALVSAPPETFAGAISLGFCPDLMIRTPLCEMRGLKAHQRTDGHGYDVTPFAALKAPWMVLQGEVDQVCAPATTRAFVEATGSAHLVSLPNVGHGFGVPRNWEPQFLDAYRTVASGARQDDSGPAAPPPEVADLPIVEVPATQGATQNLMAIILTGDGGWAELDKAVAAALAERGVPTIGWSSLKYFWTPRTPDQATADLERIVRHYTTAWSKPRVALVGYSFGADVIPFLVTRLTPDVRARVASVTLLGLSTEASFEFHIAEWLGERATTAYRTVPEIERLTVPVTCVYGAGEHDSACSALSGSHISVVSVGSGHHFGGEYGRLAEVVLQQR